MRIEIEGGENIHSAASRIVRNARMSREYTSAEFNGVVLGATPDSTVEDVLDQFGRAMAERAARRVDPEERLAKAEALLRESLAFVPGGLTSSKRLEFAARIASFLEGK